MNLALPFIRAGRLTAGKDKTRVDLYYVRLLDNLFVSFFGGRPHIGALTASLRPLVKRYQKTVCLRGHHDDVVTENAVDILTKGLRGHVVSLAGIHFDNASKPQIQTVVQNSRRLSQRLAHLLQR